MKKENESEEELLIRVSGEVAAKYYLPGYTNEDLIQEFFILAMEIFNKYDKSKGKLENFMRVALNNSAQNFIKSKTVENKPCGCSVGEYCCHSKYRESKFRVLSTSQYPENFELSKNTSIRDSFVELLPLIDKHLPASMRTDWRRILDDAHVVKSRKAEIFEEIREIVAEFENSSQSNNEERLADIEFGWQSGFFWIETELHLAKLYMDEEAANLWLHILSADARQVYLKLRSCGTVSYEDIVILANSIDDTNSWDV